MVTKERIISLILAVIVCFSLIPVSVFAQEEVNTAKVSATETESKAESIVVSDSEELSYDSFTDNAKSDENALSNAKDKKPLLAKGSLKAPVPNADPPIIKKFTTAFLPNASSAVYDADTGNYYIRPTDNKRALDNLTFQIDYTLAGGDSDHEPGTVKMVIPAHLFETRSSTAASPEYADYVASPPFPMAPTIGQGDFNMQYNPADDTYIITNCKTISRAYSGYFTITYTVTRDYTSPSGAAYPYQIKDNTQARSFSASIDIDDDKDGTAELNDSSSCSEKFFYDTKAKIYSLSKTVLSKSEKWPGGSWGAAPADADDYFYVTYCISTMVDATQPFRLTVSDDPSTNGGEVVAYLSGSCMTDYDIGDRERQNGDKDPGVPNGTLSTTPPEYGRNNPYVVVSEGGNWWYNIAYTYVLVRFQIISSRRLESLTSELCQSGASRY